MYQISDLGLGTQGQKGQEAIIKIQDKTAESLRNKA